MALELVANVVLLHSLKSSATDCMSLALIYPRKTRAGNGRERKMAQKQVAIMGCTTDDLMHKNRLVTSKSNNQIELVNNLWTASQLIATQHESTSVLGVIQLLMVWVECSCSLGPSVVCRSLSRSLVLFTLASHLVLGIVSSCCNVVLQCMKC